jgi:hypothetical protein
LNQHFTEVGIATAVGTYEGKETTFVVQMFGTPLPDSAASETYETVPTNPVELAVISNDDPAPESPAVLGAETSGTSRLSFADWFYALIARIGLR